MWLLRRDRRSHSQLFFRNVQQSTGSELTCERPIGRAATGFTNAAAGDSIIATILMDKKLARAVRVGAEAEAWRDWSGWN